MSCPDSESMIIDRDSELPRPPNPTCVLQQCAAVAVPQSVSLWGYDVHLEHGICVEQARPDAPEAVALAAAAVAAVPSLQQPVVQALSTHDSMHVSPYMLSHIVHG